MDTEELENQMQMNDYFPLLAENIKQELFDTTEKNNLCDSVENKIDEPENADAPIQAKCVWCSQLLSNNDFPKLLECLHVACDACVKSKYEERQSNVIICPVCKMENRSEYIIDNQFLSESTTNASDENQGNEEVKDKIKCSSCTEDAVATSWCVECAEFICDSCVQAHQRLKITKDHTIKTKESAVTESNSGSGSGKSIMCQQHPQEKLSLYCETCDRLTCRDCQLNDHRDHKYKFANEIAAETRNTLAALLSEIGYKKVLLSSAMKVIDDRQALISEKKKELSKEITDLVVKLTNAVNARGKQLVYRLNQVCDTKLQVLNEKKDALQLLSGHTDHCIEFVTNALDKGSDSAVLYSKKVLARHLQKVKCQRADIPNPEIPVRVQLFFSNVPELQSVIARIGTILVDGKVYPPPPNAPPPPMQNQQPTPNRSKQTSPNMTPPLQRPNMPGLTNIGNNVGAPGGISTNAGYSNVPPLYNSQTNQFGPSISINRSFSQDNGSVHRYGSMGPPHCIPTQPHVSSSTHPQNMEISLRGLLNPSNQPGTGSNAINPYVGGNNNFNGGNNGPSNIAGNNTHPSQIGRPNFLNGQGNNFVPQRGNMVNMGNLAPGYGRFLANRPMIMGNVGLRFSNNSGNLSGSPGVFNTSQQQQQQQQQQHQQQQQQQQQQQITLQHQLQQPPQQHLKWHTPQTMQQQQSNGYNTSNSHLSQQSQFNSNGFSNETFKIPLKSPDILRNSSLNNSNSGNNLNNSLLISPQNNILQQHLHNSNGNTLPSVTSTNPKTPSPSTNDNSKDFADSIDKTCEESVNDLMATIAKLDSNGVQVLPEGRGKTTSPQVHSSTDLTLNINLSSKTTTLMSSANTPLARASGSMTGSNLLTDNKTSTMATDPNEDWCAVCMDGGELMCCDKCPKVFHQTCHLPIISSLPDESETWQCLLCVNFADIATGELIGEKRSGGLSVYELKIVQRIVLELLCQYELSMPFRQLPEPENSKTYYEIVCNPISLNIIRDRVEKSNPEHYIDISTFIADVKRLFHNAYLFYEEDAKTYQMARKLEIFFEQQLAKFLPKYRDIANFDEDFLQNPVKRLRCLLSE